ncbi:arginine demethylase and lysyl-hydroxylase jmjd [Holotrichia oblita]|uniref:Arginine demethylase and lysyl-hydroxylase jmjd n=1 Tax=Holotrichia oblita TaxID=644536 RepID=A0ACB9SJI6_HOLOL|nr:arginine demethylase and lysyl-hydroxylase jmjd [Holotrichia oblita]
MEENILKELDNLKNSDLVQIIIARDVSNVKISKELQSYFNHLFCIQDKMGVKSTSSESYTVSQLEAELKQFYAYCKENNFTDEEIANICKPLLPTVKNLKSKLLLYALVFLTIFSILYLLSYLDTIQWHYSALGRIFLIELLPFWDWKNLQHEKCIVNSLKPTENLPRVQDCTFCEYIHGIDVVDAGEVDFIYRKFIKINKPVILENGLEYWMDLVDSKDVLEKLLADEIIANSYPCKFKSNTYYGSGNLYQSLRNIQEYSDYFANFQICEFDAVKAMRRYVPRPKFLAAEILPVQYTWVLLSRDYYVEKFRRISLSDQIAIVGQLGGKSDILLVPNECNDDCQTLKIELKAGEVLMFGDLWNMEIRPYRKGENLVIVLETH